jgi:hypothetical protein
MICALILTILQLIFFWDNRKIIWIEGVSLFVLALLVTAAASLTEFRIS